MKMNGTVLLIIFILFGVIISGCVDNKDIHDNTLLTATENVTEETEKVIRTVDITENIENMEVNTKPQFKIGQKFIYNTTLKPISDGYSYTEQIFSIGKKRIDKKEFYEIKREKIPYTISLSGSTTKHNSLFLTWYCDMENGECVGKNLDPTKYSDENWYASHASMFAYWMLGLKENVKWTIIVNGSQTVGDYHEKWNEKYEFEAMGKENVNDIECFKVKRTKIDLSTKKIDNVAYYWIDADRRILIKKQVYENGIMMDEINLVSEL